MALWVAACGRTAAQECADIALGSPAAVMMETGNVTFCGGYRPKKDIVGPAREIGCCNASTKPEGGCGVDCSDPQYGPVQYRAAGTWHETGDGPEVCCVVSRDGKVVVTFVGYD